MDNKRCPCPECHQLLDENIYPVAKDSDTDAEIVCPNCLTTLNHYSVNEHAAETEGHLTNGEGELPEPHGFAPSTSDDSFDEDPDLLELQEREQIVTKYEKGPDQKNVDPWENPDMEVYKITDRYGFVHKDRDLTTSQIEEKMKLKELKREEKWLKMFKEWEHRHPEKLPKRIWKGIPDKLRLVFWLKMLGVADLKQTMRENLYQELLMRARLVSKDIKQIDLDINRTYRDHVSFRRRYDVKQQSLFNVLTAYAMLNTEVGYCQGMSQITAILLMYMDEEDAFWCLHSLLTTRRYTMHGFFVPGFPKLLRFQNHYEKVLLKYLPSLKKHLDKAGIPPIYLTKWWFGCFLDRVPFSLALRLWDVFLYYGDSILMAMAYNIMKMHKRAILKLSMENFMEFIQTTLAENFGYPDNKVMESLEECLKRLQSDRMALPPPPNPRDLSELPTKALGPILTRSMLDIRSDIAEVYSRCSRANSLAGRSPAFHKRHNSKMMNAATIRALSNRVEECGTASGSPSDRRPKESFNGGEVVSPPVEPFLRRVGSTKDRRHKPPPVPDEDGFVRMSPRQPKSEPQQQQQQQQPERAPALHKRQTSQYDNVATPLSNTTTTSKSGISSVSSSQQQRSSSLKNSHQRTPIYPSVFTNEHKREASIASTESQRHRVHRMPNNITYVQLETEEEEHKDGDKVPFPIENATPSSVNRNDTSPPGSPPHSTMPYCPPPDYPGAAPMPAEEMVGTRMAAGMARKFRRDGPPQQQHKRTERAGSERTTGGENSRQQRKPMARPLYSHDETTIIRRF